MSPSNSCFVPFLLFAAASVSFAAEPRDISDVVKAVGEKHKVPGIVAAVVDGGQVSAHGAWGVRQVGSKQPFTVNDKVHLGSDTKAMTATLCAMLVEEGKLKWETTLAEVFPKQAGKMLPAWRDVTLKQLLNHRAGCPGDLTQMPIWAKLWEMNNKPLESRAALLVAVTAQPPEAAPGIKTIYSNAGYAIAGHMAETVTKKPWETLMRERLFKPLKMTSAGFERANGAQPWGHTPDGKPIKPGPMADNPSGIGPAGTVHCSIGDWAKFIELHLTRGKSTPGLLKEKSFDVLHQAGNNEHAMGWLVATRPWAGGDALTHAGSNTMWYCVAWLAPKKDFAVLIATNQGGDEAAQACDEIATELITHRS